MNKISETVVFFGSGPVAAQSLALLAHDFKIEAVITKPKPEHHRGDFPVLSLAQQLDLNVLTPTNKKELSELFATKPLTSRIGVVIDYGIIISQDVIDYFPLGIVNSHFSLLPEWRGADPITFAILSGQPKTGVSLMLIDAGLDTGKLIAQKMLHIAPDETTPTLTAKLIALSHEMLSNYLPEYVAGSIKPRSQPHPNRATYSRKLTKEDGVIDWTKPAAEIEREIRAFIEWPKSHTELAGKEVIITKAYVVPSTSANAKPGEVTIVPEARAIAVTTGQGSLWIQQLKPAGKKEMSAGEFLRGYGQNLG
jgi:methionyl-tRNA formyltransferase